MTTPELRKGEQVRVGDITGTVKFTGSGSVDVTVETASGGRVWISPKARQDLTITRTGPAQWPPKPGDVWLDAKGEPWFCRRFEIGDTWRLSPVFAGHVSHEFDDWLAQSAPATLAYRVGYEMPCWHTELPDADEPDGEACTGEVPVVDWLASNARAHGDREHVAPEKIRIGDLIIANTAPRIVVDVDPGADGTPYEIHHRNQRGGPLRTLSVHKGGQVERIRGGEY